MKASFLPFALMALLASVTLSAGAKPSEIQLMQNMQLDNRQSSNAIMVAQAAPNTPRVRTPTPPGLQNNPPSTSNPPGLQQTPPGLAVANTVVPSDMPISPGRPRR